MEIDIRVFDSVDSTNKVLSQMAREGAEDGRVVVAWKQTEGRGRLGRTFESPEGGIYMSILLPLEDTLRLTAKAGLAVKRAIISETDKRCQIKWVNDIIYNGKKVAGILAQVCDNHVVLGIGINFCTPEKAFSNEIRNTAISLYKNGADADSDPMDLVNAIIRELENVFTEEERLWLGEYKASSCLIGKKVKVIQADKVVGEGEVTEIDNNCALHIIISGTETVFNTGEVTIREKI